MPVRIRMKKLGRAHRSFFRICAVDGRVPRDGRVLEELGTYDPSVPETDARVNLKAERVDYWLGVGAQPSDKVGVLIKKYGSAGTHREQQAAAQERLTQARAARQRAAEAAAALAPVSKKSSRKKAQSSVDEQAENEAAAVESSAAESES